MNGYVKNDLIMIIKIHASNYARGLIILDWIWFYGYYGYL